jgi:hypothetical protein
MIKIITVDIDSCKIQQNKILAYRTEKIIEENWEQFSKALYADFESRNKHIFNLVRDIIQKFHLYQ